MDPEDVPSDAAATGGSVRVLLSWGLVSALLAYGIILTITTAAKLFG